jgi:hypothetical protein
MDMVCRTEVASGVSHEIVRDYLTYFGYGRTLAAFDVAAGYAPSGEDVQETNGKNHTSENWARRCDGACKPYVQSVMRVLTSNRFLS